MFLLIRVKMSAVLHTNNTCKRFFSRAIVDKSAAKNRQTQTFVAKSATKRAFVSSLISCKCMRWKITSRAAWTIMKLISKWYNGSRNVATAHTHAICEGLEVILIFSANAHAKEILRHSSTKKHSPWKRTIGLALVRVSIWWIGVLFLLHTH